MHSPTRQLADERLNRGLDALVALRRAQRVSWRRISNEIRDRTGVDVTAETLRVWYAAEPPAVAS